MMEITNEIKAKVFAQYLGQSCKTVDGETTKVVGVTTLGKDGIRTLKGGHSVSINYDPSDLWLILKPLSAISDDEAAVLALILKPNEEYTHNADYGKGYAKRLFDGTMYTVNTTLLAVDYLRSVGIDLPHYLLGGKTLHECNLAIYNHE